MARVDNPKRLPIVGACGMKALAASWPLLDEKDVIKLSAKDLSGRVEGVNSGSFSTELHNCRNAGILAKDEDNRPKMYRKGDRRTVLYTGRTELEFGDKRIMPGDEVDLDEYFPPDKFDRGLSQNEVVFAYYLAQGTQLGEFGDIAKVGKAARIDDQHLQKIVPSLAEKGIIETNDQQEAKLLVEEVYPKFKGQLTVDTDVIALSDRPFKLRNPDPVQIGKGKNGSGKPMKLSLTGLRVALHFRNGDMRETKSAEEKLKISEVTISTYLERLVKAEFFQTKGNDLAIGCGRFVADFPADVKSITIGGYTFQGGEEYDLNNLRKALPKKPEAKPTAPVPTPAQNNDASNIDHARIVVVVTSGTKEAADLVKRIAKN